MKIIIFLSKKYILYFNKFHFKELIILLQMWMNVLRRILVMEMLNVLTPLDPSYVHARKDFMGMGLHALVRI